MASPLFGKWKLERSENFDEYMKAVGKRFMINTFTGSIGPYGLKNP